MNKIIIIISIEWSCVGGGWPDTDRETDVEQWSRRLIGWSPWRQSQCNFPPGWKLADSPHTRSRLEKSSTTGVPIEGVYYCPACYDVILNLRKRPYHQQQQVIVGQRLSRKSYKYFIKSSLYYDDISLAPDIKGSPGNPKKHYRNKFEMKEIRLIWIWICSVSLFLFSRGWGHYCMIALLSWSTGPG